MQQSIQACEVSFIVPSCVCSRAQQQPCNLRVAQDWKAAKCPATNSGVPVRVCQMQRFHGARWSDRQPRPRCWGERLDILGRSPSAILFSRTLFASIRTRSQCSRPQSLTEPTPYLTTDPGSPQARGERRRLSRVSSGEALHRQGSLCRRWAGTAGWQRTSGQPQRTQTQTIVRRRLQHTQHVATERRRAPAHVRANG